MKHLIAFTWNSRKDTKIFEIRLQGCPKYDPTLIFLNISICIYTTTRSYRDLIHYRASYSRDWGSRAVPSPFVLRIIISTSKTWSSSFHEIHRRILARSSAVSSVTTSVRVRYAALDVNVSARSLLLTLNFFFTRRQIWVSLPTLRALREAFFYRTTEINYRSWRRIDWYRNLSRRPKLTTSIARASWLFISSAFILLINDPALILRYERAWISSRVISTSIDAERTTKNKQRVQPIHKIYDERKVKVVSQVYDVKSILTCSRETYVSHFHT